MAYNKLVNAGSALTNCDKKCKLFLKHDVSALKAYSMLLKGFDVYNFAVAFHIKIF